VEPDHCHDEFQISWLDDNQIIIQIEKEEFTGLNPVGKHICALWNH
jgi:hypothetical protein